jgi:hypothetical protein
MSDKPASSMGSNRRENPVRIRLTRREGFFSSVANVMVYEIGYFRQPDKIDWISCGTRVAA